jgi:replicative DNA helicase
MNQPIEPPLRRMEFVPEIERQALKILSVDPMFMVKWHGRLKPDHFNEPHIQIIFKAVDAYVTKHRILPTLSILYQGIKDHIGPYDVYDTFANYARDLFQEKFTTDEAEVKDRLMAHMREVDFDRFVLETARMVGDKEYDKIGKLLAEITVRHTQSKIVKQYLSTPEGSVVSRVAIENSQKLAIPTPWPTFNNKHGGGFHPAAVAAFMGPTGSGKSILLINAGSSLVLRGKTVYHFTFELSDPKTQARYDVCLSGASYAQRKANPQSVDDSLKKLTLGPLYVIQMSTGTCSANAVRAAINDYVMMGAPAPDVLILDYLTIMMPNNPDEVDMKRDYAKLKTIAEEVRALAMDLDLPILTALQSNRGAAGKEKISKEDIADSYAVMHVLDCCLSINQNDAEKQAGKLRLYAAKVRDYEDSYTVAMNVDYSNLRISEDPTTTMNYNSAVAKMTADALSKRTVAGVHAPLPDAIVSPGSADAGLDMICGMAVNPVKSKNTAAANLSQSEQASAVAWGLGHQPPPIASPQ